MPVVYSLLQILKCYMYVQRMDNICLFCLPSNNVEVNVHHLFSLTQLIDYQSITCYILHFISLFPPTNDAHRSHPYIYNGVWQERKKPNPPLEGFGFKISHHLNPIIVQSPPFHCSQFHSHRLNLLSCNLFLVTLLLHFGKY